MMRRFVRAVVRNATATPSEGQTLRIDPIILNAANILPLEEVEIIHHPTNTRFTTYAEPGTPGQASAPGIRPGDPITILSWGLLHDGQTLSHWATVVTLDGENRVVAVGESAGQT